jgi:hypothetical protein
MAKRTKEFNVKASACAAMCWAEGRHLANAFALIMLKDNERSKAPLQQRAALGYPQSVALGVAQSGLVLRYIVQAARDQGIGVIFITHNPHHAYLVGDHFMVLARGEVHLDTPRSELTLENLMFHLAPRRSTRKGRTGDQRRL